MSKIAVIALYNVDKPTEAVSTIRSIANEFGIGVCLGALEDEPFLREYSCPEILLSISDHEKTDNCEYFFLPDGWTINGMQHPIPFIRRMKVLQMFAYRLNVLCEQMEILVGESGMGLDDFAFYEVEAKDIPDVMTNKYCGMFDCHAVRLKVLK